MTVAAVDGSACSPCVIRATATRPACTTARACTRCKKWAERPKTCPDDGLLILSEPLDAVSQHWEKVPDATALVVENGNVPTSL